MSVAGAEVAVGGRAGVRDGSGVEVGKGVKVAAGMSVWVGNAAVGVAVTTAERPQAMLKTANMIRMIGFERFFIQSPSFRDTKHNYLY